MAGNFINPVPQYGDDNGNPLAGGILYFSENEAPWSTNPQAVYLNEEMTTPATYITLDAAGRVPDFYAPYGNLYRVVLKKADGTTVWTRDNRQFYDGQALVELAAELQEQINNIELAVTNANPIRNPTTEVITALTSVTLTTSFLPHVCVGIDGRVAANVSAGTMQSGTLSGLGITSRQAKMAGVTGDSSAIVQWRLRVSSAEARRFANETCSISAKVRQESGVTATTTIAVYKADAADNFSAVTLVGSNSTNVTTNTNTALEYAGLAMGDVSNGIELVIGCAPGAGFSLKDFYLTDIKIEVGATVSDFLAPSYPESRAEALEVGLGVFRDTGTANAITISTRDAVSLYDGLSFMVLRTAANTGALTIVVDGSAATSVARSDNTACVQGDTLSGNYYRFHYDTAKGKFIIENPEPAAFFNGDNQSLGASGFQKIPGGLIEQWGTVTIANATSPQTITFPTPFPTACVHVDLTPDFNGVVADNTAAASGYTRITSKTTTDFTTAYTVSKTWRAIGY